MITVDLILTIVGLLFLLIALVALYVWSNKSKSTHSAAPESIETFEALSAIIKNRGSSSVELTHAVETILSRFTKITPQSIGAYKLLLQTLCTHPHTDSKLILRFEKGLRTHNPEFTKELEQSLGIGLAARG